MLSLSTMSCLIYVTFASAMLLGSFGFAGADSSDLLYQVNLNKSQQKVFVDQHNKYRSQVSPTASDMTRISWDEELERIARAHTKKCVLNHSEGQSTSKFSTVGENLYAGIVRTADVAISDSVDSWHSESENYNYESNTCDGRCGHYLQIVWAKTHKIGCAVALCRKTEIIDRRVYVVSCNYGVFGNVYMDGLPLRPYERGTPCSECEENEECSGRLCGENPATETKPTTTPASATSTKTTTTNVGESNIATTTTTSSPPVNLQSLDDWEENYENWKMYMSDWTRAFVDYQSQANKCRR